MATTQNTTQNPLADTATTANREVARKELMSECRKLVADAEALMHRASNLSGEAYQLARDEMDTRMSLLRNRYDDLAVEAARRGKLARDATDRYVRDNPWQSIAAAAAVGAVLAALVVRRGD